MFLKRTLAAGAIVVASAASAYAADIPMAPVAPPPPPAPVAPVFDWAGPYAGVYGGFFFGPGLIQTGVQAGYNFVSGGFLAGIEASAGAVISGGIGFEGTLNARLGAILGSRVLLYAEAGFGYIVPPGAFLISVGGGAEFAVGQSASVFAEAKWYGGGITVQGGLNWHL